MALSKRQLDILNRIIISPEPIKVAELARMTGVTIQTIYNDLQLIEKIKISVNRGNVEIAIPEYQNSSIANKIFSNRDVREKACDYVIDTFLNLNTKGIIFIDGGSTGYLFFERLLKKNVHDLTIITNNPLVIGAININQEFFSQNSVFVLGGKLDATRISLYSINPQSDSIFASRDENLIDMCILGFRAISSDGDIYIANEEEIHQKKILIGKSRQLILITTPDKLGTKSLFKIASLSDEIQNNKVFNLVIGADKPQSLNISTTIKRLTELVGEASVATVE